MQDREHELAGRATARQQAQQQAQSQPEQGAEQQRQQQLRQSGGGITDAESRQLADGIDLSYRRGR